MLERLKLKSRPKIRVKGIIGLAPISFKYLVKAACWPTHVQDHFHSFTISYGPLFKLNCTKMILKKL